MCFQMYLVLLQLLALTLNLEFHTKSVHSNFNKFLFFLLILFTSIEIIPVVLGLKLL